MVISPASEKIHHNYAKRVTITQVSILDASKTMSATLYQVVFVFVMLALSIGKKYHLYQASSYLAHLCEGVNSFDLSSSRLGQVQRGLEKKLGQCIYKMVNPRSCEA